MLFHEGIWYRTYGLWLLTELSGGDINILEAARLAWGVMKMKTTTKPLSMKTPGCGFKPTIIWSCAVASEQSLNIMFFFHACLKCFEKVKVHPTGGYHGPTSIWTVINWASYKYVLPLIFMASSEFLPLLCCDSRKQEEQHSSKGGNAVGGRLQAEHEHRWGQKSVLMNLSPNFIFMVLNPG